VFCRFQRERALGDGVRPALWRTTKVVGIAMVANTGILTGGFATLMLCRLPAIQLFGALASVAMLAALIGDLLILPAVMLIALREPRAARDRDGSAANLAEEESIP
jgi:hypothetical protein